MGAHPSLPSPNPKLIPTVNIAPAKGWPPNTTPVVAPGLSVAAFATGLDHPRWLYVLPNGDVLVAETNAPPKPEDQKGIRGWFMKRMYKRAGAAVKSANRITLLRDSDGDGRAGTRTIFLHDLNSPFGMALVGNDFYVADSDALMRFNYTNGALTIAAPGKKVVDLPAGPINHHWTKNVIASRDGSRLYVRSARTATPEKTVSLPKRIALRSGKSIPRPVDGASSHPVSATRMEWDGNRRRERSGRR